MRDFQLFGLNLGCEFFLALFYSSAPDVHLLVDVLCKKQLPKGA